MTSSDQRVLAGTWFYDGRVEYGVEIWRRSLRPGTGDHEDPPEFRDDQPGEWYEVQYDATLNDGHPLRLAGLPSESSVRSPDGHRLRFLAGGQNARKTWLKRILFGILQRRFENGGLASGGQLSRRCSAPLKSAPAL